MLIYNLYLAVKLLIRYPTIDLCTRVYVYCLLFKFELAGYWCYKAVSAVLKMPTAWVLAILFKADLV